MAFLAAVLAVLVAVLAGCASGSKPTATAGATAPGTDTVAFHAYARSGQLSVPAGPAVRGQCWTTSIAAPAADAYRCYEGNKILDPCFAPARATKPVQLACLDAPWSRAVLLRVNGALPKPAKGDAQLARPWALQLGNGVRCVASTGTVPAVAGVNLSYHCDDGGNAALGGPAASTLTAQYAAAAATTLTTMTVTTVWDA